MVELLKYQVLCVSILLLFFPIAEATQYNATGHVTNRGGSSYDTVTLIDTEENPISAPAANEVITAGQPYTIRWKSTQTTGVTFTLGRGTPTEYEDLYYDFYIGSNVPNSGSLTWTVQNTVPPGKDYILLLNTGGGLTPSSMSANFEISNPDFKASSSATSKSSASTSASSATIQTTSQTTTSAASLASSSRAVDTVSGSVTISSTTTSSVATGISTSPVAAIGSSKSPGVVIGAAVGGSLGGLVLILVALIIYILRKRKERKGGEGEKDDDQRHNQAELEAAEKPRAELSGTEKFELEGGEKNNMLSEAGHGGRNVSELQA